MKFASALAFALSAVSVYAQCPSGTIGNFPDCEAADLSSCVSATTVPLVTSSIGELILGKSLLFKNNLTLFVESELTTGRTMTSIIVGQNVPVCRYPGVSFVKGFEDCSDTYTGVISFQDIVQNCGFTENGDENNFIYSGFVKATTTDEVGSLRGNPITRTTESSLGVELLLPKQVSIATKDLTVFSAISVEAAITGQSFNPQTDVATITLRTSVQSPYYFQSITPPEDNQFTYDAFVIEATPCSGNGACEQDFTFEISAAKEVQCNFNGNYVLTLTYSCNPEVTECPVPVDSTVQVSFNLVSGDLCSTLTVNSALTPTIGSFSDDSYEAGTPKIAYVAGQTAYLRIKVASGVDILDLSLSSLTVNGVALIESGTETPFEATYSVSPHEDQIDITILLEVGSGKLFDPVGDLDRTFTFTVAAVVDVEYRTTFGRKREVMTDSVAVKQSIVLDLSDYIKTVESESGSGSIAYTAPLAMAAAGVLALNHL